MLELPKRADTPTLIALGLMATGAAAFGYTVIRSKQPKHYPSARDQSALEGLISWGITATAIGLVIRESSRVVEYVAKTGELPPEEAAIAAPSMPALPASEQLQPGEFYFRQALYWYDWQKQWRPLEERAWYKRVPYLRQLDLVEFESHFVDMFFGKTMATPAPPFKRAILWAYGQPFPEFRRPGISYPGPFIAAEERNWT